MAFLPFRFNFSTGFHELRTGFEEAFEKARISPFNDLKDSFLILIQEFCVRAEKEFGKNEEKEELLLEKENCSFCSRVLYERGDYKKIRKFENVKHLIGYDEGSGNLCCLECHSLIKEISKCNGVLPVESVKKLNFWRRKNGMKAVYQRHYHPPKPDKEILREIDDKKLSGRLEREEAVAKAREESPWYAETGFDFVHLPIEITILEKLLFQTKCEIENCGCNQYIIKDEIKFQGRVGRIPLMCQLGHRNIFHCSIYDERGSYRINRLEGFSLATSGVGIPQIGLKYALCQEPGFNYSTSRGKVTQFFKEIGKKGDYYMDKQRHEYICFCLKTLVDLRFVWVFRASLKKRGLVIEDDYDPLINIVRVHGIFSQFSKSGLGFSALIYSFMYGKRMGYDGSDDGRYQSRGFKSNQGSGFATCVATKIVLFQSNISKARNSTNKEKIFRSLEKQDEIMKNINDGKLYGGPSGNIEEIAYRCIFQKMKDWSTNFHLDGFSISIGLMVCSATTDRDGKIISIYMEVFADLLTKKEIKVCKYHACYGHGKKSVHSLLSGVVSEKLVEMGKRDMDFAFGKYTETMEFKSLLTSDVLYDEKRVSIVSDVFMNALLHKVGKCKCQFLFGNSCSGVTRTKILDSKIFKILQKVYCEACNLFSLIIERRTTALSENINNQILTTVSKRLDFSTTYDSRIMLRILRLFWKNLILIQLLVENNLPVSVFCILKLEKIRKNKKKSSVLKKSKKYKKRRYILKTSLNKLHSKKHDEQETFYPNSAKEKKKIILKDFKLGKAENQKGISLKRKPKFSKIKMNKNYEIMNILKKAEKENTIVVKKYFCTYCEKNDDTFVDEKWEEVMKHITESHKRSKEENRAKHILVRYENEKKKMEDEE